VNCCYGGHPVRTEKKSLEHPPAILIGTPGRIVDHIERGNVDLTTVRTLILDEFDKSLELGFFREMKEILSCLPCVRRRVLTSATESVEIPQFIGMKSPLHLSFLSDTKNAKRLKVYKVHSPVKDKLETLYKLLAELNGESTLVFCNLREAVERVSNYLSEKEVANEYFHGGKEQLEREKTLAFFRNGSATVFISTDLAARGLDIPDVQHVVHYHLPLSEEAYIHRNGRTARMDNTGNAFLILNDVESVPEYIAREPDEFFLPSTGKKPPLSDWETLTISRGKRDRLSKGDVAGFLFRKGELAKEDVGIVEVRESCAYAAVKRDKYKLLLRKISSEKIKNMNAKYT
jgi:superfamily II DNA/RNA helicase